MTLAPDSTLGPYAIRVQLGHGGMGVVYTAHDPRLDRQVAIKVLPPELTRDDTAKRRFLQEAKAASALDHANICTIHEINETPDGQLYLVMAYYEGETLKQRIEQGPLALDEAVDIATQVGQGLAEAHGAGIVHRDIKPANLLIAKGGVVKILDFGLAKLAGTEGVTQTGTTVGTVAYMSPEQARGEEVDQRTDIWSLGVVLYEMLTGQQLFQGENLLVISKAILENEAPTLTGQASSLIGVVGRAVSKSKAQRYQAVADLLDELRTATAPSAPAASCPDVPSIAVLPFDNMSADPEQQYFCEGMAEEIINALAALDGLHVASRTSAFLAKEKRFDIAEIGRSLKVGAVLEGSVRKAGNRLRVTAQLINVSDGYHLWSDRYDRELDDVFAVQDEIAQSVVGKLKVKLIGKQDAPAVKRPTENLEAYNLLLRGRYYLVRMTGAALEKSRECFTQVLAVEPDNAQAHAGIALANVWLATIGFAAPLRVMPMAKEAALKSLALDETTAEAHAALALVLDVYERNRSAAEREYSRALELNPGDTLARGYYANFLAREGRADASIAEARDCVERDPLAFSNWSQLPMNLYMARRYDAAVEESRAGIELEPAYHPFYWSLGLALACLGRHEETVEALRQATVRAPNDPVSQAYLGWALGLAGQREEALTVRTDLERRRTQAYFSAVLIAMVNVGLDERERAISWLQEAAEERDALLPHLNVWPGLDPLRSDPRFQDLLRRMNFPCAG